MLMTAIQSSACVSACANLELSSETAVADRLCVIDAVRGDTSWKFWCVTITRLLQVPLP